jgi:hypothetical protein
METRHLPLPHKEMMVGMELVQETLERVVVEAQTMLVLRGKVLEQVLEEMAQSLLFLEAQPHTLAVVVVALTHLLPLVVLVAAGQVEHPPQEPE